MPTHLKYLITGIAALAFLFGVALSTHAATILFPTGGGTGVGTFTSSQLIYGNGTKPLSSVATTSASCSGSVSCTAFTVIGSSPITITGSGGGGTGAATTSFAGTYPITVSSDSAHITYAIAFGTTTSNTWGGTQTFSNTIKVSTLDGLIGGNGGNLYAFATSSLFGYTPLNPTRALTINGTSKQITSSAGAQDLSADRTWTLSLPNFVLFPGDFFVNNSTTTNATTTNLSVLTVASTSALRIDKLSDGCLNITGGLVGSTGSACGSGGGGGASFGQAWEIGGNGFAGFLAPTTTQKLWLGQASSTLFSANQAEIGATATTTFTSAGFVGIGSSTPFGVLSINAPGGAAPLFIIGSSSATALSVYNAATPSLNVGTDTPLAGRMASIVGPTYIEDSTANAFSVGATGTTSLAFNVDQSAGVGTGLAITTNTPGSGLTLNTLSANNNEALVIQSKGTSNVTVNTTNASGNVVLQVNGASNASRLSIFQVGYNLIHGTSVTAVTPRFSYTSAADVTLTASTEAPEVYWNLGTIRSHASGAIATQRDYRITGSTHTYTAGTSVANATIASSTTLSIDGPPKQGTVLGGYTNAIGLYIGAGSAAYTASTTNAIGLVVDAPTGATNNIAAQFLGGNVGIGTTTPWGSLSVASPSYSYASPVFVVATSSGTEGGLFAVSATTTSMVGNLASMFDSGVRVVIGALNQYGGPILDHLFINGRINTGDWHTIDCAGVSGLTSNSLNAATSNVCPGMFLGIDTAGGLTIGANGGTAAQNNTSITGITNYRLENSGAGTQVVAAGNGTGLFVQSGGAGGFILGTSTPVIEGIARIDTPNNATSTYYYLGFTNVSPSGSSYNAEPTIGCYFLASSTLSNWQAVCRTSAANVTIVDTNFASTTDMVNTGLWNRFRLEADGVSARFYMATSGAPMRKVATISTNYPATNPLQATVYVTNISAGLWKLFDVADFKLWYRQPALNY